MVKTTKVFLFKILKMSLFLEKKYNFSLITYQRTVTFGAGPYLHVTEPHVRGAHDITKGTT